MVRSFNRILFLPFFSLFFSSIWLRVSLVRLQEFGDSARARKLWVGMDDEDEDDDEELEPNPKLEPGNK